MAGHSHWAGIKHQKAVTDAKRAKTFSKLLKAISAAAKSEPNPDFNPRLRTAVAKAKEAMVPADNIERAIKKAGEEKPMEELFFEAYGPGSAAILIEALADNRNRMVQEVKKMLGEHGGKWAEAGSVLWAFEKAPEGEWRPKFPQEIGAKDAEALADLVEALEEHEDVQGVTTNACRTHPKIS
jgi:YebC/PmpR family DNA-binding regulatory protein